MNLKLESGLLPGRKRHALWLLEDGRVIKPLAYFVSEEAYMQFMALNPMYIPKEVPDAEVDG